MKKIKLLTLLMILLTVNCGVAFLKGKKQSAEQLLPMALLGGNSSSGGRLKVNTDLTSIGEGKSIEFQLSFESGSIPVDLVAKSSISTLVINNKVEYKSNIGSSKVTLTLTALEDENKTDETGIIEFTAPGYTSLSVQVTCKDNDVQRILVSNTPSTLLEGFSGTGKVRLNVKPTGTVMVNVKNTNQSSLSVTPASLTFTPDNYATEQTINFSAVEDSNSLSETVAVEFSATDVNSTSVSIQTIDNDIHPVFSVSAPISINEGTVQTFTVQLDGDPSASKVLLLQASMPGVISISPSSINYDSTNWNNPTTITVTALQDANAINETITLTAGGVGLTSNSFFVTSIDDETQNLVVTGTTQLTEGQSGTLLVSLSADPTVNTTVTLTSSSTNVTLSPTTIVFSSGNYFTPKTISVITNGNDGDDNAETVTVTMSGSGLPTYTGTILVIDKDTKILLTGLAALLTEGQSSSINVKLSGDPGITANVSLSSNLPSLSLGNSSLTFTSANWNTNQVVSITAVEDVDHTSDTPLISLAGAGLISASGTLNIYDNDTTTVFGGVSSVVEGGTGNISVKLSGNPLVSRTITVSSASPSDITVSPTSLVFDSTNWNTPQTVVATGLQDTNLVSETVSISASGSFIISQSATLTKTEDDTQSFVFSTSSGSVNEGGNINLTLKLAFQPPTNLPVTVSIPTNTGISFSSGSFSGTYSNTFTSANWSSGFTIPVYGMEDVNTVAENVVITASAGGSPSNSTLSISSVDNDVQAITIPSSLSVNEGSSNSFLVKLLFDPISPLTVTLTLSSSAGLSFSSGSTVLSTTVSMTSANYSSGATATVYALADTNNSNESVTLTANASGVANQTMSVSSVDGYPTITSVPSGKPGDIITITGTKFLTPVSLNTITIDGAAITISGGNNTSLTLTVPDKPDSESVGAYAVVVSNIRGSATDSISINFNSYTFTDNLNDLSNWTQDSCVPTTSYSVSVSSGVMTMVNANTPGITCSLKSVLPPGSNIRSFETMFLMKKNADSCGWDLGFLSDQSGNYAQFGQDGVSSLLSAFSLIGYSSVTGSAPSGSYYYFRSRYDASSAKMTVDILNPIDMSILATSVNTYSFNILTSISFAMQDCGTASLDSVSIKKCYYNEAAVPGGCW